jgi:hypothetical protein
MNKFFLTASALIALSGLALADTNDISGQGRNYDLRDSDTYNGPFATKNVSSSQVEAFRIVSVARVKDADIREQHRLDEKH